MKGMSNEIESIPSTFLINFMKNKKIQDLNTRIGNYAAYADLEYEFFTVR
jgi:hypothetical protein